MSRNGHTIDHSVDTLLCLQDLRGAVTDLAATIRGNHVNKILNTELIVIPTSGVWTRDFSVPFAALAISTLGDGMTIAGAPPQGNPPGGGVGVHKIPAGGQITVNLAGNILSVYGVAGDQANLQVFLEPQAAAYSDSAPTATVDTGTATSVASSAADVLALAANPNRDGAVFFNESTAVCYLLLSGTSGAASLTNYSVQIPAGGYFELPPTAVYSGQIRAIWAAANGFLRVTELT
jgi:hypothetical protein